MILVIGFILGTFLGSLVKVLADRSLTGESFWGRSYCPHCKINLQWYDLFPIFSYLILGGKCRYCKKGISLEYLLVEVALGVLTALLFWQASFNFKGFGFEFRELAFIFDLLFKTFFISSLAALTLTDLKKTLIPDRIIIPSLHLAFFLLLFFTIYRIGYLYFYLSQTLIGRLLLPPHSDYFLRNALMAAQPLWGSLLSAFLISGFFLSLIMVTRGRGMGGGDVKLGAFIGLGLGFPQSILATIFGFLTGAIAGIILIIFKKKKFGENIPFGPFLVLGSIIALFLGQQIIDWYLYLAG